MAGTAELIARINANLRLYKSNSNDSNETKSAQPNPLNTIGQWKIDRNNYRLINHKNKGDNTELTYYEYTLLCKLLEEKGHVVKRDDLCTLLKKDSYVPTPRAIDIKVSRIRKKLGKDATLIKTIRYTGYMIV